MSAIWESIYHLNNYFHTVVGSLALIGGFFALVTTKGSANHKLGGKIFAWLIVISAITSYYPTFFKFREIGPVAIIMATATIYLVVTAISAIRNQSEHRPGWEKVLICIPLLLIILPVVRIVIAVSRGEYEIFIAPLILLLLFIYLFITDLQILRNRRREPAYWQNRHMTRMVLAFAFGVMALVRIGIDFGLTFEMSIVLPLLVAVALILYSRRKILAT